MKLIKKIMEIILRRESKKIIKDYNQYINQRQITPPETIEVLRSVCTNETVNKNLEILNECIETISKTKNPSIVLDRYEYGLQSAYALRQLEDAGIYSGNPAATEYIDGFIKNKVKYIKDSLERAESGRNTEIEKEIYLYRKVTYFTKEEEALRFDFSMDNSHRISQLTKEFNQVWLKEYREKTTDDELIHLNLVLERLHNIRDFCNDAGKGGQVYYTQIWEEFFNSKNPCFSQEEVIIKEIEYCQNKKEKLELLEKYSSKVIKIIEEKESIYQKDLYKVFPELDKEDIKDIVSELSAKEIITKEKKGNSYELKINR